MPKRKINLEGSLEVKRSLRPALTPEARENQMISLAMDLVEERLRNGTASSQETTHFLKLGSSKNKLEVEKLKQETELLKAKQDSLESTARIEQLYNDAMSAMRTYSGNTDKKDISDDKDDDDDD